ncbi:TraB/GumN family protein [Acidovorax cavernicola]|uniref:TraB/GumN family protein n=1 Tax=Acidovorax cavernicola TaxID=1675792 RepID=UPI002571156F|nr:TraB/GumN family protein [Acidovorax cavernicola]
MRILRALVAPLRLLSRGTDRPAPQRLPAPLSHLNRLTRQIVVGVGGCFLAVLGAAAHAATCPPSAIASLEKPGIGLRNGVDRGLLWRIERDGRTSWLYGTMHLGRGEWVRPGPTVQNALTQSDTLALELDSRDEATVRALSRAADPAAVARVLSGERARRLERQNAEACVPPGSTARLPPILQVTALTALAARVDGLYPEFGVDETLAVSARNSNKPIVALENAADQLRWLTDGSEAEEGEQIDAMLDELESGRLRGQLKTLADVWARSDAARLARYAEWCECLNTPAEQRLMKRLLDDRNPGLADGIERLHAGGRGVFAAVGALHMVGAQGLPTLMASRGFRVTPVLTEAQAQMALPMPPLAAPEPPARKAVRGGKNVKGQKAGKGQGQKAASKSGARAAAAPRSSKASSAKAAPRAAARAPAPKAANSKVRR